MTPAPHHQSCPRKTPNDTEGEYDFQLLSQKEKWLKCDGIVMTNLAGLSEWGEGCLPGGSRGGAAVDW